MKQGDTYSIPQRELEDEPHPSEDHRGHTVTVLHVKQHPSSTGPDPDDGYPDTVSVRCSCGSEWSFTDYPEPPPDHDEA